jgi:hypothetical protein
MNDSLKKTKNKLGQEESKVRTLVGNNEKTLLQMESKDSTIIQLQASVEDYKGKLTSATSISNTTIIEGSTQTVVKYDTINNVEYPIYESVWDEKWLIGKITATKDSVYRNISFFNKFNVVIGEERQKLFGKREFNVTVTNLNPNTITNDLRTFQVEAKKKPYVISLGVGYGIGAGFAAQPFIGIHAGYKILSF